MLYARLLDRAFTPIPERRERGSAPLHTGSSQQHPLAHRGRQGALTKVLPKLRGPHSALQSFKQSNETTEGNRNTKFLGMSREQVGKVLSEEFSVKKKPDCISPNLPGEDKGFTNEI